MLGEKREVGRMGEAVADRGSEEGLRGSREAPVVDEFAGQLFPGEQGESGEKRRDIAKMKRHDVVKIRRMIAAGPRPLGVAVCSQIQECKNAGDKGFRTIRLSRGRQQDRKNRNSDHHSDRMRGRKGGESMRHA